jgi:putative hydrolase of the HAD superfamily
MVLMPTKAVLFDLDDTLVARAETFALYCEQLIRDLFPEPISEEEKTQAILYMIEVDRNGYENRDGFFRQVVNKFHLPQNADQLVVRWFAEFGREALPKNGLIETLQHLHPKYRLAVVTNGTSAMQNRKIDALGIRRYFNALIISEEIGCRKPDKQIYMTSCESLDVDVSEAVFIGDNYQLDVAGPRQAGMSAIWFCSDPHELNHEPRITTLKDLQSIL